MGKETCCNYLEGDKCNILDRRCMRLSLHDFTCDMRGHYINLSSFDDNPPHHSAEVRKGMLNGFLGNWRRHAENPRPGKKDMTARPMESVLRAYLISELGSLGVKVYPTGKKLIVWDKVHIIADALTEQDSSRPQSIFSFKTWIGAEQLRETFGYAYFSKTWLGQRNVRVYMVGLNEFNKGLDPLIKACKPYIDGVYSLCGYRYFDELVEELVALYSARAF